MKTISLSKGDFSLLEKIGISEQLSYFSPVLEDEQVVLVGTKKRFEKLLEIIADELSANGFSDTFEPTEHGRALERVIDIFSIIYE